MSTSLSTTTTPVQDPKPRIILGLMNFGPDVDAGGRITTLSEFNRCLDHLQQRGYNEIDTARLYMEGKQEEFTAAAQWKKRGLVLATKVYPASPGFHSSQVLRTKVSESLQALQTNRVDFFYLHAADRSVPFAETLETVNELYEEGKLGRLGLSNYAAFEVAEIVTMCNERGWVRPTIYQAVYNAITRSIEPELIPCCRRYGMDIVVYNPLAGGILSGKYTTAASIPTEGRYSDRNTRASAYREKYFKEITFEALKEIESVLQRHNVTVLETALRWLRHHSALNMMGDGNDGVLIGVSSFSQLEANLNDLEKGPLPDEVVRALDGAWMKVKATAGNYWHLDLMYSYDTVATLFGKAAVQRNWQ